MNKRLPVILFICMMSISSVQFHTPVFGQTTLETLEYVILFDEAHGQYFNRSLMEGALSELNNLIPENNETNIEIQLLFQDSDFNSTNLQGIDLLIITNPGLHEDDIFVPSEIEAILDFVELGGSLFLLSNPLTQDPLITGHPTSLNQLLAGRDNQLTSARINTGDNASYSNVIIDDFSHEYENESYVVVNIYNQTNNDVLLTNYESIEISNLAMTIYEQELQINTTLTYTSSFTLANEANDFAIGRTPATSYSVDEDYDIIRDPVNGFLTWLLAKAVDNSRFVLSGSTIMFSDLVIVNNETWIEQVDNMNLWKNIILWLLKYTPHPPLGIPPIWNFQNYALIVVSISIVVFGSAYALYRYKLKRKSVPIKIK